MKKAEEYLNDNELYESLNRNWAIRIIKQAQKDAIRETANECGSVGLITDHMLYEVTNKLIKEL